MPNTSFSDIDLKKKKYVSLLEILEALCSVPLLAHLIRNLPHGGVAVLPDPRVAPRVDLLPVLHACGGL